jgi:hypothetical protein
MPSVLRQADAPLPAFPEGAQVTATDAVVTITRC